MTEKKTAEEFLKEKGIIKEGYSKWICRFEDGNEFDIGALIREYAAQELADYKAAIEELIPIAEERLFAVPVKSLEGVQGVIDRAKKLIN